MVVVPVQGKTCMKKFNIRFDQRSASAIRHIVRRTADQQLSGLSPAERGEILRNLLVTRNPDGSSLKVHIATTTAVTTEFGTRSKPARPWVKKFQRRLVSPVRSALVQLLTPKR